MKAMVWFIVFAAVGGVVYGLYRVRAKWEERNKASEERFASFMSQALPGSVPVAAAGAAPAPTPAPMPLKANNDAVQQRLLLSALSNIKTAFRQQEPWGL